MIFICCILLLWLIDVCTESGQEWSFNEPCPGIFTRFLSYSFQGTCQFVNLPFSVCIYISEASCIQEIQMPFSCCCRGNLHWRSTLDSFNLLFQENQLQKNQVWLFVYSWILIGNPLPSFFLVFISTET